MACYSLKEAIYKQNIDLPEIHPISDLSELLKLQINYLDQAALVNKIITILKTLNIKYLQNNVIAITEIAEYIEKLIYKSETYNIDFKNFLNILDENLSLYKQEMLQIIKLFFNEWSKNNNLTKAGYNNILIEKLPIILKNKHLIIAGINSITTSIINLLQRNLSFKNSELIFYGIDSNLKEEDWHNINYSHPQYNFKFIMDKLGINPIKIISIGEKNKQNIFLSEALKPAKSCYKWHNFNEINSKIRLITALDQHQEANIIINFLKDNYDKRIMLVTSDNSLIEKLALHLEKYQLPFNIIQDIPLYLHKTSIWLVLSLNFILEKHSLLSTLALLKGSFAFPENLNELEITIRNNSNIMDIEFENPFFQRLKEEAAKFNTLGKFNSFSNFLTAHISFAEKIADSDIWESVEAQELKAHLDQCSEAFKAFNILDIKEYKIIFELFLKSIFYRPPLSLENNITILKPLDARLHKAETMILAGLNEGIWPTKSSLDPALNNNILNKIGFPSIDQMIGEEAYDFQCLAEAEKVILTRSEKINGQACIASRWFLRLNTLSKEKSIYLPSNTEFLTPSTKQNFIPPIPELQYRPTQLSATQIEKLVTNPYHIYVDLILNLKKLPPLKKELSTQDFGNFIHKSLEIYYRNKNNLSIEEAGLQALKKLNINSNKIKLLWWPRFTRIAEWLEVNQKNNALNYVEVTGKYKISDNFTITAKADRIDMIDNYLSIIDYKTGKLSSQKSIYSGQTLQLLLEGIIALNAGFIFQTITKSYKIKSLQYMQLSGNEQPVQILDIDIQSKDILEHTKKYILQLIAEYQISTTPYYYTEKKTINYCYYEHLARMFT